jgi:hypothetical protein
MEMITGTEVVDADGERLGSVIAATEEYFVVEQGFFFPTDYYIPRTVIAKFEETTVWLSMRKVDVLAQGWSIQPNAGSDTEETTTAEPE